MAESLEADARTELQDEGVRPDLLQVTRRVHLRYDGTDTAVPVDLAEPPEMRREFEESYRRTYTFLMDRPLVVEAVAVEAVGVTEQPDLVLRSERPAGRARRG